MPVKLTFITVGLISFAALILELLQTRILSFIFYAHMVYLAIAIALLGLGISGSLIAVFNVQQKNKSALIFNLLLAFYLSIFLALAASVLHIFLGFDSSPLKIVLIFALYTFPFIFAGSIISICLAFTKSDIGKLYATDLLCAGLACIVFSLLLPLLNPTKIVGALAFAAATLATFWAVPLSKKRKSISIIFAALAFPVMIWGPELPFIPDNHKEFAYYLAHSNSDIEKTVWTPLCRIDLLKIKKTIPGIDFWNHWHDYPIGSFKVITQDGGANTGLYSTKAISLMLSRMKQLSTFPDMAIVFKLKTDPDVAIIGVGGGLDIINALGLGAKSILAGELNPAIYDLIMHSYANYTGNIFDNPRIKIVNEEGRSMLRQHHQKFDVIHMFGTDTFAALSTGAYVLSENYLYTVEAFREMLSQLRDNGILSVIRWHFWKLPRESLRVVSIGCEAMKSFGQTKNIDKQICVIAHNGWATSLFKNSAFTDSELKTIVQIAAANGSQVVYFPKLLPEEEQLKMELHYYKDASTDLLNSSKVFNDLITSYVEGQQNKFFANYPFNVSPTTDDEPFFYEYHQKNLVGLPAIDEVHGNASVMTLYIALIESVVFMVLAIYYPLLKYRQKGLHVTHARSFSIYFMAIGCGFMLIEVALIQKSILFLGNPLYSLSVILSTLLISAGLGSNIISRLNWPVRRATTICGALFLSFMLLLILALKSSFYSFLELPYIIRIIMVGITIFPLGILMGTFFPVGLRQVQNKAPDYIPWAWGINGCSSVFGSFAAIILAMSFGFTVSLLMGALVYSLAFWAAFRFAKN